MRVAIIGCSHTYTQRNNYYNWAMRLADKFPQHTFDNYAYFGHGHLWMDMVLKHILYECEYDYIIVQLTSNKRWHMAIECGTDYTWHIEDTFGKNNNLNQYYLETAHYVYDSFNTEIPDIHGWLHQNGNILPEKKYWQFKRGDNNLAKYYSDLFVKQLDNTPNLCYYNWVSLKNEFCNEYGEEYVLTQLMDETLHYNDRGHQLLFGKLESLGIFDALI